MAWYELNSVDDPKLDELAERFHLHPLHVEDSRSPDERIKVEQGAAYTFAVLKPGRLIPASAGSEPAVAFSTIDIFAGNHEGEPFFITIADPACPTTAEALARARREGSDDKPAKLLYLILDTIVDLYFPVIDHYDEKIDDLEDRAIAKPEPDTLQRVFALKRQLTDLRRVLVGTRDAALHLQRDPESIMDAEHQPFVRDIYDHIVRLLDSVETQRDLVNNSLDVYLSSVANRTNEVMKVLTVLGTIVLPAIAISGIYGMNVKGLPFEDSPHGAAYIAVFTVVCTVALLAWLKKRGWS
ncbi:MAG TPA: magnesium transporter CorA family protein [Acidobacteriaceae bacterium]